MRTPLLPFVLAIAGTSASANATDARTRVPVVVELFTSEGCSSCPTADDALADLEAKQPVDGVELVPLSFHVDYWNRLGWKDPFSSEDWSARQDEYARAFGQDGVYTPQMIVNGEKGFVGNEQKAIDAAKTARSTSRTELAISELAPKPAAGERGFTVRVPRAPQSPVELWLFVTESGLSSNVTRGENAGRTLKHAAVVRSATRIDTLKPGAAFDRTVSVALNPSWNAARVRVVAVLQDPSSRRILGAATTALAVR